VVQGNGDALVAGPSGYRLLFVKQPDGTFKAPAGFDGSLLKTPSGWMLSRTSQGDQFGFNGSGQLSWTKDRQARDFTVQGTSAAGRDVLSSYGTNSGRRVNFSYTGDSLVREMDDPSSGHHYYGYTGGKLTSYRSPSGAEATYRYAANGYLDKIAEPGGSTVELTTTAGGRVQSITTTLPGAVGQTTSFVYTRRPYKTDVTGPDGVRRTYAYDDDYRVTRQYNPDVKPTVTATGELRELADQFVGPNRLYPLAVSAKEPDGAGLKRLAVERASGEEIAGQSVPCAATTFDLVCPTAYAASFDVSFANVPEGRQVVKATATDEEANRSETADWTLSVDKSAPLTPSDLRLSFFSVDDPAGTASFAWNAEDPDLSDGTEGSGVERTEVRSQVGNGPLTAWTDAADNTVELSGLTAGDAVHLQVRAIDAVGNISPVASSTVMVAERLDDPLVLDAAARAYMERFGGTLEAATAWMVDQAKVANVGDDGVEALVRDAAPGRYGGVWADNRLREYRVQVTSEGDRASVETALTASGIGAQTQVNVVNSTLSQLDDARQVLDGALRDLLDAGVVASARDTSTNGLRVMIAADANGAQRARVASAASSSSVHVDVVDSAEERFLLGDTGCRFPNCDLPLRGGVQIHTARVVTPDGTKDVPLCTAGFLVRATSDRVPYLLTAGHCIRSAPSNGWRMDTANRRGLNDIGAAHPGAIDDSRGDVGLIRLNATTSGSRRNSIYVEGAKGQTNLNLARNESYKIRRADFNKDGDMVCFMGRTSKAKCAVIIDNSMSFDGTDNLAAIDTCADLGDSGGPVFFKNLAYGIIKGRRVNKRGECLGQSFYTGARQAEGLMNVKISG
jgi:hypothetical protein